MDEAPPAPDLADVADLDVTLDGLTGGWRFVQRRRGHRHSTDDLLTAWYAAEHGGPRAHLLDLGAGVGSVGLSLLWRSPEATLVAVEAQAQSHRLLVKNVALNGLGARVTTVHGDLREPHGAVPPGAFDVVTGSPPYFDVRDGVVSPDDQRAHARFELRGDVRDYARAAARALRPDGRFAFCFPTGQRDRAQRACDDAGLVRLRSRDVVPRAGRPPLFSLFLCRLPRPGETPPAPQLEPDYVVRDAAGQPTEEHRAARATFGWHRG